MLRPSKTLGSISGGGKCFSESEFNKTLMNWASSPPFPAAASGVSGVRPGHDLSSCTCHRCTSPFLPCGEMLLPRGSLHRNPTGGRYGGKGGEDAALFFTSQSNYLPDPASWEAKLGVWMRGVTCKRFPHFPLL